MTNSSVLSDKPPLVLSMARAIFLRRRLRGLKKLGISDRMVVYYKSIFSKISFGYLISKISELTSKLKQYKNILDYKKREKVGPSPLRN